MLFVCSAIVLKDAPVLSHSCVIEEINRNEKSDVFRLLLFKFGQQEEGTVRIRILDSILDCDVESLEAVLMSDSSFSTKEFLSVQNVSSVHLTRYSFLVSTS